MKGYTDITIVLDRSGSMNSIMEETLAGYNNFIAKQKTLDNEAYVTLTQFDHEIIIMYNAISIRDLSPLTKASYVPRGTTALLDAIGKTIDLTEERISLKQHDNRNKRPEHVIIVIITDGHENSSSQYHRKQIFDMIRNKESEQQWDFVFIGANQDAIAEAGNLGVEPNKAMTFKADQTGTQAMFISLNEAVTAYRKQAIAFDMNAVNDNKFARMADHSENTQNQSSK